MKTLKTWSLFLMTFFSVLGFAQNDPMIFRINFPDTTMTWGYSGTDNFQYTTQKVGETVISETKTGTTSLEVDTPGEYLVSIMPPSNKVTFNNSSLSFANKENVLELLQWGDIKWASMQYLFSDFNKLTISATDIPDTSSVKNFSGLFHRTKSLTEVPNINTWDTSQVTNMSSMFNSASSFNQPLSFDTSNVTNMSSMFYGASTFNQPLNFDTSNVTNMFHMFYGASTFNQPLSFDTSRVTNMGSMFSGASSFDQLLTFDTSKVTYMGEMFYGASSFNQPLNFDTGNVINMSSMFNNASSFNQPLTFDTSNVMNMSGMFSLASSFNQPLSFDTSNVTNMSSMFYGASTFNQPLNFDTSKVTNMSVMFSLAKAFNQPLNFDTSNVTNMSSMFYGASTFNQPLNFDTSNVTNMGSMFKSASSFNQPLNFDTSNVTNMSSMFYGASTFNQPLSFDTNKVTSMYTVFYNATAFNQDTGSFQLGSNVSLNYYGYGSGIDCNNYSKTLKGWASQSNIPSERIVSFGTTKYGKEGKAYRDQLSAKGWSITDGGLNEACEETLSLESMQLNKKVSLYPNPTSDLVYFTTDEVSEVKIFSAEGQLVKSLKSNVGQNTIDVSNLRKGIYFITIGNQTQKLIKK